MSLNELSPQEVVDGARGLIRRVKEDPQQSHILRKEICIVIENLSGHVVAPALRRYEDPDLWRERNSSLVKLRQAVLLRARVQALELDPENATPPSRFERATGTRVGSFVNEYYAPGDRSRFGHRVDGEMTACLALQRDEEMLYKNAEKLCREESANARYGNWS